MVKEWLFGDDVLVFVIVMLFGVGSKFVGGVCLVELMW